MGECQNEIRTQPNTKSPLQKEIFCNVDQNLWKSIYLFFFLLLSNLAYFGLIFYFWSIFFARILELKCLVVFVILNKLHRIMWFDESGIKRCLLFVAGLLSLHRTFSENFFWNFFRATAFWCLPTFCRIVGTSADMLCLFSLLFWCSESIISNQIFGHNYCSLLTSFLYCTTVLIFSILGPP